MGGITDSEQPLGIQVERTGRCPKCGSQKFVEGRFDDLLFEQHIELTPGEEAGYVGLPEETSQVKEYTSSWDWQEGSTEVLLYYRCVDCDAYLPTGRQGIVGERMTEAEWDTFGQIWDDGLQAWKEDTGNEDFEASEDTKLLLDGIRDKLYQLKPFPEGYD